MSDPERWHALALANAAVTSGAPSHDVLAQIVHLARETLHARYGVLAIVDDDGRICQMIHDPPESDVAVRANARPEDIGMLRLLIENPGPLRLRRVPDRSGSSDPAENVAVGPLLAAPLQVRGIIRGHLCVTECAGDEFSPEDDETLAALAGVAAIAVEDARILEQQQRTSQLLQATRDVTDSLLGCGGDDPLTAVARVMRDVSSADVVLVILPMGATMLMVEAVVGDGTDHLVGYAFPRAGSLTDSVLQRREVILVTDARNHGSNDALRRLTEEVAVGPAMFVPLDGEHGSRGVIVAVRRRGGPVFDHADVDPATAFANHATLALELADGRSHSQQLLLLEERQRIAAELHDHVLQRLFAAGMSMQAIAGAVEPEHTPRFTQLLEATDEAIVGIRTVIRKLHGLDSEEVLVRWPAILPDPGTSSSGQVQHDLGETTDDP